MRRRPGITRKTRSQRRPGRRRRSPRRARLEAVVSSPYQTSTLPI
jgi:hypothetical protein